MRFVRFLVKLHRIRLFILSCTIFENAADARQVLTPDGIESLRERLQTMLHKDLRVEFTNRKITGKESVRNAMKSPRFIL
jgi:hypothetical protein